MIMGLGLAFVGASPVEELEAEDLAVAV